MANKLAAAVLMLLVSLTVQAAPSDTPLFYKLQQGNHQAWLLGSIHVGSADFYPFPKPIQQALGQAQGLVLEANPNDPELTSLFGRYALAKQPLPKALAAEIQSHCKSLQLQCNLQLAPWLLSSQIALMQMAAEGYQPQYGIETKLLSDLADKPLYELEGMASQLAMFDSLSQQANITMAKASLEAFDVQQMVEVWRRGDRQGLMQLIGDEFASDELMDVLLYQRNHTMAEGTVALMQQHDQLFVAVGAAHLVGQGSVVELLRQQGIKVTDCWQQQCF